MPPFNQANILVHPPKDRSLLIIAAGVVVGHVLLLLWVMLTHSEIKSLPNPAQRRLVVQTIALNPSRPATTTMVALQDAPSMKKKVTTKVVKEIEEIKVEEIKAAEPEPSPVAIAPKEVEKEIIPTPVTKEPPAPIPETPVQEVKKEIAKPIEEPASKPAPIKLPEPAPLPTIKATAPKKPEVKKKVEEEKPVVKKAVVKAPPPKSETQKKAAAKPPEKKVVPSTPPQQTKPKKIETDKAAVERQKKIEAEQQAIKAKQQKLLSQAQETIAKIDKSRDKVSRMDFSNNGFVNPGAITSLQIDSFPDYGKQQLSSQEVSYRDELAGRLKLLLKLPEYGEVKIKLILERSGKVAKVIVMSTASATNRKYIEKTLPTLTFPAFGANFDQSPQFTFSITLCNDL